MSNAQRPPFVLAAVCTVQTGTMALFECPKGKSLLFVTFDDGKQVPLIEEEEDLRKNGVCRVEIPFTEEEREYWSKASQMFPFCPIQNGWKQFLKIRLAFLLFNECSCFSFIYDRH